MKKHYPSRDSLHLVEASLVIADGGTYKFKIGGTVYHLSLIEGNSVPRVFRGEHFDMMKNPAVNGTNLDRIYGCLGFTPSELRNAVTAIKRYNKGR